MTIGITMTLRIHLLSILSIDQSVKALVLVLGDVVVKGIDHLPSVDSTGIVPIKPIVCWSRADTGLKKIVPSPKQPKFLLQQARDLPLKREQRGGNTTKFTIGGSYTNGWVGRVSSRLVA